MPLINVEGLGPIEFADDMTEEQIRNAIEKDILPQFPELAAQRKRTWGETAVDVAAGLGKGVASLGQLPGQVGELAGLFRPEERDVGLQGQARKLEKFAEEQKSPTLKAREELRSRKIAESEGFFDELGTSVMETIKDPALVSSFFFEQLPNLLATGGAGALSKAGVKMLMAESTAAALGKAGVQEYLGKVGVRTAIGTGAVMQGADIGADTFETIYTRLKNEGVPEEKALEIALSKGRIAAIEAAGLSLASSKLPGGATIERAMLGKGLPGAGGFLRGTLGEAFSEAVEEGGGALAKNINVQQVFPDQRLLEGVGAATGMGALGGALFGAPAGVMTGIQQRQIQKYRDLIEQAKRKAQEEQKAVPLMLPYDPSVGNTTYGGTPIIVNPDGTTTFPAATEASDEALAEKYAPKVPERQITEAYASEEDRKRVEDARWAEARKNSPALQKLDAIKLKKVSAEDQRKADQSAFAGAEPVGGVFRAPTPEETLAEQQKTASYQNYRTIAVNTKDGVKVFEGTISGNSARVVDDNGKPLTFNINSKNVIVDPSERDIYDIETKQLEREVVKAEVDLNKAKQVLKKKDEEFLAFLRANPIDEENSNEVIDGIRKWRKDRKGYRALSPSESKGIFKPGTNRGLDQLAQIAVGRGFLSKAEFENPNDLYGTNALRMKINQLFMGESPKTETNINEYSKFEQLGNYSSELFNEIERRKELLGNVPTAEDIATEADIELEGEFDRYLDDNSDRFVADLQQLNSYFPNLENLSQEERAEYDEAYEALKQKYQNEFEADKAKGQKFEVPQTPYTDKFLAEAEELARTLRASLDKMGLKQVGLNLEDVMTRMVNGKLSSVNGAYLQKLITLSLSGDNIFRTMNHEALHAMRDLGFFSDSDWSLLTELAKTKWIKKYNIEKRYADKTEEIKIEEAIADAFADMQTQPAEVKSIMSKIVNVLKRIGNVIRGKGFRTAEDIFRAAAEGKLSEQVETAKQWNELLEIKPIKKPLSDSEIKAKKFADNIEAKKFANRQLPDGTEVMVRLNLNGTIERPDGTKMHLVTVHEPFSKKKDGSYNVKVEKPIGYDGVVTIRDVDFIVNQRARANIVSGKEAKSPMGGAQGKIVHTVKDLEGVRITFNPLREHVFVRVDDGRPIKHAEEMTVSDTDAVVRGKIDYYTDQDMPTPLDGEPTAANFDGVSPMDVAINRKPIQKKGAPKKEELFEVSGVRKTDTPAFRNWFGNSKVVDENGAPRVMYHGTASDITKFYPNQFFTFSPKAATTYALKEQYEQDTRFDGESDEIQGANILPVYIKAENIAQYEDVMDTAKKLGLYDEDKDSSYQYTSSYTDQDVADAIIADLKKQGFDSIYHHDYDLEMNRIVSLQVFNPVNIKSVNNVGTFSQADEAIRYEVPFEENLRAPMKDVDEDFANKIRGQFAQKRRTVKQKFDDLRPNMAERLIKGLFDEFKTIERYDPEAYMLARMSKSVDGALEGLLMYGQVFLRDGAIDIKPNTKGLLKILEPLGTEVDQYQIWKALSRDAMLPAEKRSFKDLIGDRNQLIRGELNGKPRKEVYEQALKEENALNKSVLDLAKQQGLIDEEAYKTFSNDIYYIPFYKAVEEGKVAGMQGASKLTNQYFSKALKGGDKKTNDLMENVLMNWSHILSASMKNKAAVKTLDAAVEMGAAEKVNSTYEGKDVVKVMVDGKQAYYAVNDPDLVDSISLISYLGPKSPFLDVARGFTNALRYGITLSPAYKVRNLIRDSIQSAAVSGVGMNIIGNVQKGMSLSDEGNPTFISALASGGIFEMGVAHEGDQAKLIKRLVDKGVSQGTILDSPEKIKAGLQKALEWYNRQGNRFENANRLALYDKLISEGKNHLEASYAARDLMDFSLQGSFRALKIVSQLVPFFNARLQGLYKLGRDGISPTYRVLYNMTTGEEIDATDKQKAQRFMAVSSAVMMASMLLYMAFKDDEDFQRREGWDRDNFWWFKAGDTIFRIPKPFEIGALGTIAERSLEQIMDENVEGKVFAQRLHSILMDTFAMNPTPQFAKPLIDLYANKDSFTGAPIETAGMERLSKQERYTDTTSALAKALGGLSQVGSKILTFNPQAEGISPVQFDYAIKAYLGWAGATAASVSDKAVQPWSEVEKPGKPLVDTLAMGFVKTMPETQSKFVSDFYDNSTRINQVFADMKRYAEIGQMDKVAKLLEEKGDDLRLQKIYDSTTKQIAMYRKQIQILTNDKEMDKADKRNEIARMKILISEASKNAENIRKELKRQQ